MEEEVRLCLRAQQAHTSLDRMPRSEASAAAVGDCASTTIETRGMCIHSSTAAASAATRGLK